MTMEFKHPELHFAQIDTREIAALVSAAADLTLVVDGDDVIKDLSHNLDPVSVAGIPTWRGLSIEDVVSGGSRPALRNALGLARDGKLTKRFDVNHLMERGRDLPVQYSALRIGGDGHIMLVGRDLRPVAELQQKLLANRHSLDQNARNQKQAEAHYRHLFETTTDAIVILDAKVGRIREINFRAATLLGVGSSVLNGKRFAGIFEKPVQAEVQSMLAGVASSGTSATLRAAQAKGGVLALGAELFRAGSLTLIMVRLANAEATDGGNTESGIESLVRNAAEAVLLTDDEGNVIWANESFLSLADIPLVSHVLGRPLSDFLQWSSVERDVLFQNVRRHGRVPQVSGTVRGASGRTTDVDLSAVAMPNGTTTGIGFVMRALSLEGARHSRGNSDLTRTAENLVEMIGRVPLKELVRDTTDVIERMCIEAALKLTGDNRASAARVLGLSRQALYLKMNRFGIADTE